MLEEFVDHRKDNTAVPISEGMIQNWNGRLKPKKTMHGWDLLMQAKDQSLEWVTLKEAKESFLFNLPSMLLLIILQKSLPSSGGFHMSCINGIGLSQW